VPGRPPRASEPVARENRMRPCGCEAAPASGRLIMMAIFVPSGVLTGEGGDSRRRTALGRRPRAFLHLPASRLAATHVRCFTLPHGCEDADGAQACRRRRFLAKEGHERRQRFVISGLWHHHAERDRMAPNPPALRQRRLCSGSTSRAGTGFTRAGSAPFRDGVGTLRRPSVRVAVHQA